MRFTQRSSVDLPAPLGPITMTISPAVTARSTRSTTGMSPKIFDRPRMSSSGAAVMPLPRLSFPRRTSFPRKREPRAAKCVLSRWVPAFAGMTTRGQSCSRFSTYSENHASTEMITR